MPRPHLPSSCRRRSPWQRASIKFTLSKRTVKKGGKVIFTISNKGTEVHDFKVIGKIPKSRFIAGGQKTTLTLTFKKAGTYQYVCTIGEHAIKGMQGTLIVK